MCTVAFLPNCLVFSLGSLFEAQMVSYPTRSSFQGMSSTVPSESACGQNPTVNTQTQRDAGLKGTPDISSPAPTPSRTDFRARSSCSGVYPSMF